jgi:hypothetical protein
MRSLPLYRLLEGSAFGLAPFEIVVDRVLERLAGLRDTPSLERHDVAQTNPAPVDQPGLVIHRAAVGFLTEVGRAGRIAIPPPAECSRLRQVQA